MPRERNPNRDRAAEMWRESGGKITNRHIAETLDENEKVIAVWKQRDRWNVVQQSNGNVVQQAKSLKRKPPPPVKPESDDLTEKQQLFVIEYLRDFNATRAAIAVGYSKKTAYATGWEILRKPNVQAEIERQKDLRVEQLGLSVERVIAELMKIAFTDISDVLEFGQKEEPIFDAEGNLIVNLSTGEPYTQKRNFVALRNADEVDSTVISEMKKTRDGVTVKLHDKMRALEKLERYIPFMTEEEKLRIKKLQAEITATEMKVF